MFKFMVGLSILGCVANIVYCEKVINCYYGTWAAFRPGKGKLVPSDVDPNLCTHLSYAFFGISTSGEILFLNEWIRFYNYKTQDLIRDVIALKEKNPRLKVMAAVGGWNEGSVKYSAMAADATKRATFISSAIQFIMGHGFDGLDLDWEYPGQRGGSSSDRKRLTLSVDVGAASSIATVSYEIPAIARYADYINIMAYDFASPWNKIIGHNAPLRGPGENTVETSVRYWLQQGAPAEKLILGIASYGHTYAVDRGHKALVGTASEGPGVAGPYTRERGYLGYNEICENFKSWTVAWDANHSVPYAYGDRQWVSFDDARSVRLKMDFLKALSLGGAMMWSIETDDFRGVCGERYPLLRAINAALVQDTSANPA